MINRKTVEWPLAIKTHREESFSLEESADRAQAYCYTVFCHPQANMDNHTHTHTHVCT